METLRTMLFAALGLVLFMIWQAWEKDYGQSDFAVDDQPATVSAQTVDQDIPNAPVDSIISSDAPQTTVVTPGISTSRGKRIRVVTDVYEIELNSLGGDIKKAKLRKYAKAAKTPDIPFTLMNDGSKQLFITQSGLLAKNSPDHTTLFTIDSLNYALANGQDKLEVVLHWRNDEGLVVDKVYTFTRGSYEIGLDYRIKNNTTSSWQGSLYRQFKRTEFTGVEKSRFLYTYTGAVISNAEDPYEKIKFGDIEDSNLKQQMTGGWVAMIQHYFIGALLTDEKDSNHAYTKVSEGNKYVIGMVTPKHTIVAGSSKTIKTRFFIGPKLPDALSAAAPNLQLTIDYGWLTILAEPLAWLLNWIQGIIGNWGWSIIVLTILIKLGFYKLSEASYRSMANLRRVHPRLTAMKERYGDDKAAMQKQMMKIYKEEKINPLGGCLPILVQIPVFISLYWVLLESVELRQASFIFWLTDLSSADPYYVLPLIMGATMVLQQRLNPTPLDPVQAKVMMMLPIVFTVFFAFFPAGLVLYWVANNILSISQQWVITKRIAGTPKPPQKT